MNRRNTMKSYYIEEFSDKAVYLAFLRYMLLNSNYYSFICFKYKESEKTKKTTKEVLQSLAPYKIYVKSVNEWPGTITQNDNHHIYRLIVYKASLDAIPALSKANCLFDWDYPRLPMDLAFYKDGYAWFASSSHERWNSLYTNDETVISDLKQLGVRISYDHDVNESSLFYITKYKL